MMYDEPEDEKSYAALVWESLKDLLSVTCFAVLIVVIAFMVGYWS